MDEIRVPPSPAIPAKTKSCWLEIFLVLSIILSVVCLWFQQLPKFHDITLELGDPLPLPRAFVEDNILPEEWVQMLTDPNSIDVDTIGTYSVTLMQGWKIDTVMLSVVDTTAPAVVFQDVKLPVDQPLSASDFIVSYEDLSPVSIKFPVPPVRPETYGEQFIEVAVVDDYGNTTSQTCSITYVWMREAVTLELGEALTHETVLLNPAKDTHLVAQESLDNISSQGVGEYVLTSTSEDISCECVVTVQDTTPPELVLQWVTTYLGEPVAPETFVQSVTDLSEPITVRYTDILPNFEVAEIQVVTIEAEDACGNIRTEKATLEVITDTTPPVISGLTNMSVAKNSSPNYTTGVSAYDDRDGAVNFTYDASKVNLSAAGTYFVTYSAKDKAGNTATARRKVTVNHDAADTAALVSSIASGLGSGAETLRDHVRNTIGYSSNWGGNDPIWFGFKNKTGNCYVHALCFQALLREKGYTTQLIWVTDKSHYWNLVYLNGRWVHMDSTPSTYTHSKYSIMNDAQRLETLSRRDWDHSAWPACP